MQLLDDNWLVDVCLLRHLDFLWVLPLFHLLAGVLLPGGVDAEAEEQSQHNACHLHNGKGESHSSNGIGVLTNKGLRCVDAVLVVAGEGATVHQSSAAAVGVPAGEVVVGCVAPVHAVLHATALQLGRGGAGSAQAPPPLIIIITQSTHSHCLAQSPLPRLQPPDSWGWWPGGSY